MRQPLHADVLHAFKHLDRLDQAAALAARQVDLRGIARHDDARAEAHARQKHFHLLGGGVLRLVEDDKRIGERAAAHVRQRRNLDHTALLHALAGLRAEHVKHRVVQRPQVGIDLLVEVAGQEAQLFARLHRRTGQHNALDLLALERGDGHRHRQIGLARSRRTNAEGQRVAANRAHIFPLAERLAADGAAAEGRRHNFAVQVIQLIQLALFQQAHGVLHHRRVHALALFGQRAELFQNFAGVVHIPLFLALHHDIAAAQGHAHPHQFFQQADVFVPRAEHILQSPGARGQFLFLCQRSSPPTPRRANLRRAARRWALQKQAPRSHTRTHHLSYYNLPICQGFRPLAGSLIWHFFLPRPAPGCARR